MDKQSSLGALQHVDDFPKICVGGMRFPDSASCEQILQLACNHGLTYIDTCPCYCWSSPHENSEVWIGKGLKRLSPESRLLISTKSAATPSDPNSIKPDLDGADGILTESDFFTMLNQSLERLGVECLEWYQLWKVLSLDDFHYAMRPYGWMDGAQKAMKLGLIKELGVTSHCGPKELLQIIDTGLFKMVTVPFHLLDTSRWGIIDNATSKGIKVVTMNPLCGGLLAGRSAIVAEEFQDLGIQTMTALAVTFQLACGNVHPLMGFSNTNEVIEVIDIWKSGIWQQINAQELATRFTDLFSNRQNLCTNCGYCRPCPMGIEVGKLLRYWNAYSVLGLKEQSVSAYWKNRSDDDDQSWLLETCSECGHCEAVCPNRVKVVEIFGLMGAAFHIF